MRKVFFCSLILLLIFRINPAFSQENKINRSHHNIFLELGGMSFLGASINYEYSFLVSKLFRINPGLGLGYEYQSSDTQSAYSFNIYPALKVLIGRERHFFELGIYANFSYDNIIGGIAGYRYCPKKSPVFLRISINRVEYTTTTPIWGGLTIGIRL